MIIKNIIILFVVVCSGCKLADTYQPSISCTDSLCPRLGISVKFTGTLFEAKQHVRMSSIGNVNPHGLYLSSSNGEITTDMDPLSKDIVEYAEMSGFNCRAPKDHQFTLDIDKVELCHVMYDDKDNSLNDVLIFWGSCTLLRRGSFIYPFRVKVYNQIGDLIGDKIIRHKGYVLSGSIIPLGTTMSGNNSNVYPAETTVKSWYFELIDEAKKIILQYENRNF